MSSVLRDATTFKLDTPSVCIDPQTREALKQCFRYPLAESPVTKQDVLLCCVF